MLQDHRQLANIDFLAFDTETTGLFPSMHRLVEVSAACFRLDGRELAIFQTLNGHQVPIPEDVQQVHRVIEIMVRGQPTDEQIIPHVIEFLAAPDTILLAHNAPFDLGFLSMAMTRLGIACPPHCLFDTLDLARRLYPIWPSHSLEHVAIRRNVPNGAEHRARSDARLVKDVFLELLRRIPTVNKIADPARLSSPFTSGANCWCAGRTPCAATATIPRQSG
jgi:DNA polymerase III subunit epsilon